MADQLSLYNGALRLCRERRLANLLENREPRRLLDDAWGDGATNGAVKYCLQMGQWTDFTRTGALTYETSIEPEFGHRYAFEKPEDYVRTVALCSDEFFNEPLLQYADERAYWYASIPTIYVKWVSNDSDYGADLALWPETFAKMVELYLANEIVGSLTGASDTVIKDVAAKWERAELKAKSLDAMNKPAATFPEGGWNRSRRGNSSRSSRWNGEIV